MREALILTFWLELLKKSNILYNQVCKGSLVVWLTKQHAVSRCSEICSHLVFTDLGYLGQH